MLVTDIVKFFIFLIILASAGSALEKDLCDNYGDTEIMQTEWGGCLEEQLYIIILKTGKEQVGL